MFIEVARPECKISMFSKVRLLDTMRNNYSDIYVEHQN